MKVTRFDPARDLIYVAVQIWGPRTDARLTFALDTGSTETLVVPDVLDDVGYSARDGEQITVIRSAIGDERGYMIRVERFAALGFSAAGCRIHAHDLPDGYGIDGVLGLSFLRQFNYEIRSTEGRIVVDRAES